MVSRFKILLEKLDLSAAEFADKIGVQRSSMSHILSGRNKPSVDFLQKIFMVFPDINANWLITGAGEWNKAVVAIGTQDAAASQFKGEKEPQERLDDVTQPDKSKPPAEHAAGPVEQIIIVYSNNTFRILDPDKSHP